MPEIIDRRISFNAGEISPWLDPRIDLAKYQMGCRTMENIRGSIYGGAIKRSGTEYLGAALPQTTPVCLITWLGGDGTDYVLEFSNLKLRIWNASTLVLLQKTPLPQILTITTVADVANTLDQKTFILRDGNDATVGFWLDTNGAGTAPAEALACGSQVKITLTTGDSANTVATKVAAAIDAQSAFIATASTSTVTVTAAANGERTSPSASTSTFTLAVTQNGVTAGNLELTTVFTEDELEQIQYGQQNDVMYFAHPNHLAQVLLNSSTGWIIGQANFDWPATLGPNSTRIRVFPLHNIYNSGAPATYTTGAFSAGAKREYQGSYYQAIKASTVTIPPGTTLGEEYWAKGTWINAASAPTPAAYNRATNYTTGQQVSYGGITYVRTSFASGDVDGVAPTGNTRSDLVWDTVGSAAANGADAPIPQGESIILESSEALFNAGHVGTTWIVSHQRDNPKSTLTILSTTAANTTSEPVYCLGAFSIATTIQSAVSGMSIELVIEQSNDLATWETYTGLSLLTSNTQQIVSGSFDEPVFLRARLVASSGVTFPVVCDITPDSATQYGLATITAYTDTTHAIATVTQPIYRPWPTKRWEEPAFSSYRGFPRAVTLHDNRLWFGGTTHRPTTVWGSTVDAYWDFRLGVEDDRAMSYTLATDESSTVEWLVSQDLLVIGTSASEWVLGQRPGDDGIRLRRNTSFGSAAVQARAISDSVVFVQKSRRKLREFAWSFERDGYLANDLTQLAEHLGDAEMRQIAIQRNPEAIVWVVTARGDLLALTYERGQQVAGWSRFVTDGTVESICVIPAVNEEDILWMCVVRTINGSTVRYIERIAPDMTRALKAGETDALVFSDCSLSVDATGGATDDVEVAGVIAFPTLEYASEVLTRPSYSTDGGLYTLTAEYPKAYGTLEPGGANNDIFLEAVTGGTGGNSITGRIVIDSTTNRTQLAVGVAGSAITVTSGDKYVMRVTTNWGYGVETVDLYASGTNEWTDDGLPWSGGLSAQKSLTGSPGSWVLLWLDAQGGSSIDGTWPDDGSWTLPNQMGGNATVSAVLPKSQKVTAAINANGAASALVTASNAPGNDGTGAVAAVGPVTLANGSNTVRWRLTGNGSVWLAASTETNPWDILPGDWSAVSPATGTPEIIPASASITGLSHLEGEEVTILADGSVHRPLTVSSGAITLDYSATTAIVGLPYTATLEPTYLESPDVAGFSKVSKKRIHRVIAEMWKTAGVQISTDEGNTWTPLETRTAADLMDSNRTLATGVREEYVAGASSRQVTVQLRSADPLPMHVQSLHIRYQIDAK